MLLLRIGNLHVSLEISHILQLDCRQQVTGRKWLLHSMDSVASHPSWSPLPFPKFWLSQNLLRTSQEFPNLELVNLTSYCPLQLTFRDSLPLNVEVPFSTSDTIAKEGRKKPAGSPTSGSQMTSGRLAWRPKCPPPRCPSPWIVLSEFYCRRQR